MRKVKVAAVQMSMSSSREENISKAEKLVREAAAEGANIVLLPELFETPYFCQERNYDYYSLAFEAKKDPAVIRMTELSRELNLVIPVSFFERARYLRLTALLFLIVEAFLAFIERRTFQMTIFIRKNSIFLQEIQALKYLKLLSEKSA